MAHFLPAGKLIIFFAKSAVKPVAKRIVNFTKNRPGFVNRCQWIAEKNHNMYVNISKWSGNRIPLAERHPKMSTEEAVEFCTDLLGEMLIISAGIGFIFYEFRKNSKHKAKSNETDITHSQRLDELEQTIIQMNQKLDNIETQVCTHD